MDLSSIPGRDIRWKDNNSEERRIKSTSIVLG